MEKVAFSPANGDHLIFTGDMINKGPQSLAVVDFARQHYASCVRGNHEDRILLLRQQMKDSNTLERPDELDKDTITSGNYVERKLAKQLNDDEADWLEACPVILKLGQIKDMGQAVVVHGGLVPGVELERQDPSSVMNMRTIDLDTHVPSPSRDGMPWTKVSFPPSRAATCVLCIVIHQLTKCRFSTNIPLYFTQRSNGLFQMRNLE